MQHLGFYILILPREVGIYGKNRQQHNLAYKHRLQRFEEVCFEVVNRDDKAHMRRRKHLSGNAEGHSDTGKIQASGMHSGDNRRHTGEHADDEADAGDDDRHRQRRALEGSDDFLQHLRDGEYLDKVEDAEHIEEHLHINGTDYNLLEADLTLGEVQHEEQSGGDHAHAYGGVHVEENNEHEGEHNRRQRQP